MEARPPVEITVAQPTLSTVMAQHLLELGVQRAEALGRPMTVAVVDASGRLLSFVRMVGSPIATIQTAQDKAWTAVATRRPTHVWQGILESDLPLRRGAVGGIDRIIAFGGGYPIVVDGELVGGIGVSGAHYDVDRELAAEILEAAGLDVVEEHV